MVHKKLPLICYSRFFVYVYLVPFFILFYFMCLVIKRCYTPLHKPTKTLQLGNFPATLRLVADIRSRDGSLGALRESDTREPVLDKMDTGPPFRLFTTVC